MSYTKHTAKVKTIKYGRKCHVCGAKILAGHKALVAGWFFKEGAGQTMKEYGPYTNICKTCVSDFYAELKHEK